MSSNQIEKFKINVKKAFEELEEIEIKPTEIHSLKPAKFVIQNKKRHFYKLESFNYFNTILTSDLLDVIAFVSNDCISDGFNSCVGVLAILLLVLEVFLAFH